MILIRNLLALVGLLALIGLGLGAAWLAPYTEGVSRLDVGARKTYLDMARILMETGSAAQATVWKTPVADGLKPEDVEDTMRSVANELNIKNVGELPLYKQVEAMTGKPFRFMKIYMFCNPLTAAKMVDYDDAFSAYLPCRIALIEDKQGRLWLYTLNMDLMIHGGRPLPPGLAKEAKRVKLVITEIMRRAAAGEF